MLLSLLHTTVSSLFLLFVPSMAATISSVLLHSVLIFSSISSASPFSILLGMHDSGPFMDDDADAAHTGLSGGPSVLLSMGTCL